MTLRKSRLVPKGSGRSGTESLKSVSVDDRDGSVVVSSSSKGSESLSDCVGDRRFELCLLATDLDGFDRIGAGLTGHESLAADVEAAGCENV